VTILQLPGAQLYYEVTGSGAAVVLVHGLALDTRMWDDQVPALSEVATVVRYDARGFGRSVRDSSDATYTHAEDLWLLLDHLQIDSAVLVGLSMGGRIVLEATVAAPERVRSLVLLDAVVDDVAWDDESTRGMQAIDEGLRSGGLVAAKEAWLRHGFFDPARRSPEVTARLGVMAADYTGIHWTDPDPHGPHPDILAALPTIHLPTTVVVGELDVPCFHEMADVLATSIPGARLVVIEDAGHMVNMEAPEAVTVVLREVLAQADGADQADRADSARGAVGLQS
jgi:3-oxoadipate enol-lactonase